MSDTGANDPARELHAPGGREIEEPASQERPPREQRERGEGPVTGEVRIDALEASVAAGLSSPPNAAAEIGYVGEATSAYELPDWSDPPTGQVPRVLLEEFEQGIVGPEPPHRGPTWREDAGDWDQDADLSYLAEDDRLSEQIAGREAPREAPFSFIFDEVPDEEEAAVDDASAWSDLIEPAPMPRRKHRRVVERKQIGGTSRRSALVATATGLALGGIALGVFVLGPAPAAGLVALLAALAAGEAYGALQRAGYHPATLVGIVAAPALVAGGYAFGARATLVVLAGSTVATGLWYLRRRASDAVVVDAAVTMFVVVWVGVLASFAALLLSPASHPDRHGIALVGAALLLTVAHDVGSYAVGSRLGRHQLAPRLSPGKTLEGLLGGTVVVLAVAALVVSRIHPLSMSVALGLGAFVAVFAPLGDLFESAVKRDLGLKDMGNILPAHGGVLDRIDAMLFVLPAAWCLFRLAHLA